MKARLVIGYEMLEGSSESIVLDLIAGMLVRRFSLAPEIADMEGLVYTVEQDICQEVVAELEEYLDAVEKSVRVRFEGWAKIRKPDIVRCEPWE
ncbi:MAG: hypothetical protein QXN04_06805 [Pyrobaculum sp.]